jgi:hypothetical protein
MKNSAKKILCAALVAASCTLLRAANVTAVIPAPVNAEARAGVFTLTPDTSIASDAASKDTAKFLAERLRRATGFPLPRDFFDDRKRRHEPRTRRL